MSKHVIERLIKVRAIIFLEGKLLCVKHKNYNSKIKPSASTWSMIGGGLEINESLADGVSRELVEETGVAPEIGKLLYIQQFSWQGYEFLEFFFHIENPKDYISVDLNKTSHGLQEIEKIEFIDPKNSNILPRFLGEIDIAKDISEGVTKLANYL